MVKTKAADGTMLVTAWESRWLPVELRKYRKIFLFFIDTRRSESVGTKETTETVRRESSGERSRETYLENFIHSKVMN